MMSVGTITFHSTVCLRCPVFFTRKKVCPQRLAFPALTAPTLVIIGALMFGSVKRIDWNDPSEGKYDSADAFAAVQDALIQRLPGEPWRGAE